MTIVVYDACHEFAIGRVSLLNTITLNRSAQMWSKVNALIPIAAVILTACGSPIALDNKTTDEAITSTVTPWSYQSQTDKMRASKSWTAINVSENKADMQFPYEGGSPVHIELWQSDNESSSNQQPILVLENGQFDCHSCQLAVKFDDGPVLESSGTRQDCGESQCINLNITEDLNEFGTKKYIGFHKRLIGSKKMTIEVPLYHFGSFQYEFNTSGLIWPQPGAPTQASPKSIKS